jgi:hypothetical protein
VPFSSRDPPKRGFSGRPLFALGFAVGMGILSAYIASRLNLDGMVVSTVFLGITGAVSYLWYLLEKPRIGK